MIKTLTFVSSLLGLAMGQDAPSQPLYCSAESSTREGYTGNIGKTTDSLGNDRCYSVITPTSASAEKPVPVLFWFHAKGGDASNCGQQRASDDAGKSLAELAGQNGFALVCAEATQFAAQDGSFSGEWQIPVIMTNTTGNQCAANDTGAVEITYLNNIVTDLGTARIYDQTQMFTSGCSQGSAMSFYSATCFTKMFDPSVISAFATHSTGLKVKGDGITLPVIGPNIENGTYANSTWGECDGCQYFPAIVEKYDSMKACIYDNKDDQTAADPMYYHSSLALETSWKAADNLAESHYKEAGGECKIWSYADIITCLDNGSGRLLPNGPIPTPEQSCIQAADQVCPNLKGTGGPCLSCLAQHKWDPVLAKPCSDQHVPWENLQSTYCDPNTSTLK